MELVEYTIIQGCWYLWGIASFFVKLVIPIYEFQLTLFVNFILVVNKLNYTSAGVSSSRCYLEITHKCKFLISDYLRGPRKNSKRVLLIVPVSTSKSRRKYNSSETTA